MNTQDIEMVRWWQRNDRVTLSIASDPAGLGRMSWATRHFGLPWQRVWGLGWEECNADLSEFTPHWTYRIDPAWEPPVEPVKNADEKKPDMLVCPDSEGDKSALCDYCPHRKEHGRCGITCRETFCTTKQKRIACVPVKLPEPVDPWDEFKIYVNDRQYYFLMQNAAWRLTTGKNLVGYSGIYWEDPKTGKGEWSFTPQGMNDDGLFSGLVNRWVRPCVPKKIRFWRGG